jgi:predicted glycoside hydrolase/deacetylase ChbG (UPF0249 family)
MRVVVNADDFGLSADTADATIECFDAGAVTSATLMPTMPAADVAMAFARARPDLDFGVHLTFVGEGSEKPVSDPRDVPDLVDAGGNLLPTGRVRALALLSRLPVDQIEREIEAQIAAVRDAGISVSHVDSHRHVHKLRPFQLALRRVLPRLGISRVRRVQDVYLARPYTRATYWLGAGWQRGLAAHFTTTAHFYMPGSTNDLDWHDGLVRACDGLKGGTLEVGVHPGTADPVRADERRCALLFALAARRAGHELVPWSAVG